MVLSCAVKQTSGAAHVQKRLKQPAKPKTAPNGDITGRYQYSDVRGDGLSLAMLRLSARTTST